MSTDRLRTYFTFVANACAGILLLIYTYLHFFDVMQPGFLWDPRTGVIIAVDSSGRLQAGDRLIQVNQVRVADYLANQRLRLFPPAGRADTLTLVVERAGQPMTIAWPLSAQTGTMLAYRVWNQWFLAWVFWGFGALTLLLVRPRDSRWRLLVAFCDLTALTLITSVLARDHVAESAIVGRMVAWLSVPAYWHLHWVFPEPLRRIPKRMWAAAYLAAGLVAGLEWLQLLPTRLYLFGLLAALLGIVVPLGLRLLRRQAPPGTRALWLAAIVAVGPTIIVGVAALLAPAWPAEYGRIGVLFGWPLLPALYFYAAYRRQLGTLETRANRTIGFYLFLFLLCMAIGPLLSTVNTWLPLERDPLLGAVLAAVAGALSALGLYRPFQRGVDRYLLGMPLPPTRLLQEYSGRLAASPDLKSMIRLLRDEILPSLMVRQSALLRLDDAGGPHVLYAQQAPQIPGASELAGLLAEAERYRLPPDASDRPQSLPWVRLVLPLRLADQVIGVWLLGRRDPDDLYAQAEIASLRALADQTAIALAHLLQTERLRQMHQANIDRDEQERAALALELHDDILNELALIAPGRDARPSELEAQAAYQRAVQRVRQIISGLRPAMLAYGLRGALEQLGDDLDERAGGALAVSVSVEGEARYPAHVEQHLFRIAQQAGENALKHAGARRLRLSARLAPNYADLSIEDDGRGLPPEALGDLSVLIERRHFGLAGVHERAALIGAALRLYAQPGRGTRIHVTWQPRAQTQPVV